MATNLIHMLQEEITKFFFNVDIWNVNNTRLDRVSYNYQANKNMRASVHIKSLSKSQNVYTYHTHIK